MSEPIKYMANGEYVCACGRHLIVEAAPEIGDAERKCCAKIDAVKDSGPDIFTVRYVDGYHKGVSDMVAALRQD